MPTAAQVTASAPQGFALPEAPQLETELRQAISACAGLMQANTATYADDIKAKANNDGTGESASDDEDPADA